METNNKAHRFVLGDRGIVQQGFAQWPCYCSAHMILIGLTFIHRYEGHFFGPLRKRSRVLYDVPDFFELLSHCFSVSIYTPAMYISVKAFYNYKTSVTYLLPSCSAKPIKSPSVPRM
jgi:hypothetical protein